MYQLGHRSQRHYWRFAIISVLVISLLGGGFFIATKVLTPNTRLVQSQPVVRNVPVSSAKTQHIVVSPFMIDLPATWKAMVSKNTPKPTYMWQGTVGEDQARWIDIYIDVVPTDLAVNRLLPVQVTGDRLDVTNVTSDNCANFTDKSISSEGGTAPAKWGGVSFLCDMGNYLRDVVAIGSPDGVNQITLTGPTAGSHRIFLVYTDNSANPDYTVFSEAVKSFSIL